MVHRISAFVFLLVGASSVQPAFSGRIRQQLKQRSKVGVGSDEAGSLQSRSNTTNTKVPTEGDADRAAAPGFTNEDPLGNMVVVGHRGSSVDFPENTVQAAAAAFEKGAIGTEFDVHVGADNRVFVLHDSTLDRTASREPTEGFMPPDPEVRMERIDRLAYGQLRDVDVGSYLNLPKGHPERVPLFEDLMEVVLRYSTPESPKFAFCELKRGEVENMALQMTSIVRTAGYQKENLIFISFDIRILWLMKQTLPEFRSLFIACGPSSRVRYPACSTPYEAHEAIAMALYPKEASEAYDAAVLAYHSRHPEGNPEIEMEFASRAAARQAMEMQASQVPPENQLAGIDLMAATDYATKDIVSRAHQHNMQVAVWVWPNVIPEHVQGSDGGDTLATAQTLASFEIDFFTSNLPDDIVATID